MKIYPTEQNHYHLRFYLVADDQKDMVTFTSYQGPVLHSHIGATMIVARLIRQHLDLEGKDDARFVRCQYQSDGIWDIDIFGPAFKVLASHHEAYIQGYETKSLTEWLSLLLLQPEAVAKT